jgi:hypothetical protein
MLSPLSMDSSTALCPWLTIPSTGIFVPGFTSTVSPGITSSTGISLSSPFSMIIAVFGARPISFLIASPVRPFDAASRDLPSRISAMITPAVSKYRDSTAM